LTGLPLWTCFLLIHVGTSGLSGRQNISVISVVNQSGIVMPVENYSPARVDEFCRMIGQGLTPTTRSILVNTPCCVNIARMQRTGRRDGNARPARGRWFAGPPAGWQDDLGA